MQRATVTLLVILTVFAALYHGINTCYAFDVGYTAVGTTSNSYDAMRAVQVNITVPDDYLMRVESFSIYLNNNTAGVSVQCGIYDNSFKALWISSDIQIDGATWYVTDLQDAELDLITGSYWLVFAPSGEGVLRYYDTGGHSHYYDNVNVLTTNLVNTDAGDAWMSAYISYHYESLSNEELNVSQTSIGQLVVLLFLLALNVLLIFKGSVPVLNMIVGIVGLALIASSLGGLLFPFPWYMTILLLLTSMLVVMRAAMNLRGT